MGNKTIQKLDEVDQKLDQKLEIEEIQFIEEASQMSEDDLDYYDEVNRTLYKCLIYGLFYPFQVLAANRMLNTIIQRKQLKTRRRFRMFSDFKDIRYLTGGIRGLYLGFLPWTVTQVIREISDHWAIYESNKGLLEIKKSVNEKGVQDDDEEEIDLDISIAPLEVVFAAVINVGTIISLRMQSVDYEYSRKLLKSMKYIVTKDLVKCLFKGFCATYIGTWIILQGIQKAYMAKQADHILVKIVEEIQPKEIAFSKPENEVQPHGHQKMKEAYDQKMKKLDSNYQPISPISQQDFENQSTKIVKYDKAFNTWPLFSFLGLFFAYPWFVIASKVQYSGFEGKIYHGKINHRNMFKSFRNVTKFEGGLRGLYQGFVPASIFLGAIYHEDLYYFWTGKEMFNVRQEIQDLKIKYKY